MRYAIVSDLHANLAAWKIVLADIADQKIDTILCLGDVVGYGPNPVEVLESVYQHVAVTVMGNHDAAVSYQCDPNDFSERAKAAVFRHRKLLSAKAIIWLKRLPYLHQEKDFCCVHGDFSEPEKFHYVMEPESALPSWKTRNEQLLFVGHSHLPGIYVIGHSETPHYVEPCDFILEDEKRYLINPGSVGYPRAGDCRSSYCIYDTEKRAISFRLLPFDFTGYRASMHQLGCKDDGWILEEEQRRHRKNIREHTDFSRGKEIIDTKQNELDIQTEKTVQSVPRLFTKKMKILSWTIGILLGILGSLALVIAFSAGRSGMTPSYSIEIPPFDLPVQAAYPLTPPNKNFIQNWPKKFDAEGRLSGWRYAFEDRTLQHFHIGLRDSQLTLLLQQETKPLRVRLETSWINLAATDLESVRMQCKAFTYDTFKGTIHAGLSFKKETETQSTFLRTDLYELRPKRGHEERMEVNRKISVPKQATHLQFFIEGEFMGKIELFTPYTGQALQPKKEE